MGAGGFQTAVKRCSTPIGGAKTVPPPVGDSADRASHHGVHPQPAVTIVTCACVAVGAYGVAVGGAVVAVCGVVTVDAVVVVGCVLCNTLLCCICDT